MFLWMMLNTIVKITADVASDLQRKIKLFATKGLHLYVGENIEIVVIEMVAICMRLSKWDLLPSDVVNDIIKGLSLCGHAAFAKVFEDFKT